MKLGFVVILVAVAFGGGFFAGQVTDRMPQTSIATSVQPLPAVTVSVPVSPPVPSVIGMWKSENSIWSGDMTFRPDGTGIYGNWSMTWRQDGDPLNYMVIINRPPNDGGGVFRYRFRIGDNPQNALLDMGGSSTGYNKFSSSST